MLSLIVAMNRNQGIGIENKLPWNHPDDLKHFRETTYGHTVVMGRKTHESIGRMLPGRVNIVLSSDKNYRALHEDVVVTKDVSIVFAERGNPESHTFIIGGGMLYKLFLPYADRLYITRVHDEHIVDTYFPTIDFSAWDMIYQVTKPSLSFYLYERNPEHGIEKTISSWY